MNKKITPLMSVIFFLTIKSFAQTQGTPESGYSRCLIYSGTGVDQTFTAPVTTVYYIKLWGTDNYPLHGINYYRLKMIDNNNTYKFSSIIKIDNTCRNAQYILFYPNPFCDKLKIILAEPAKNLVTIFINDLAGKTMLEQTFYGSEESIKFEVDVSPLKKGIYTIKVIDENNALIGDVQKIIKK